jgi:glycosyltransferase involved in cell wall biosynthesis
MPENNKKIIVLSGISLFNGGAFSILKSVLEHLSQHKYAQYHIIALVYDKKLLHSEEYSSIEFIEFKKARKSWFHKLFYEYFYFFKLSKKINPFLWLSLHDITPFVIANRQAVYCHNSYPFVDLSFKSSLLEPTFFLFNRLYNYIYKININKNKYVIVQQEWLRTAFSKNFKVLEDKIIVAYPEKRINEKYNLASKEIKPYTFIYPVYPRVFKNFEVIGEAVKLLIREGISDFKVILTIDGKENRYSQSIYKNYTSLLPLGFVGYQDQKSLFNHYLLSDCLIFPSKVETWGLPISEYKIHQKPILLADSFYTKETIGSYDYVGLFEPDDAKALAIMMKQLISGDDSFLEKTKKYIPKQIFAPNWEILFEFLLN